MTEETWINQTRAAFSLFWDCTVADHLFDCGKLDGVCSSSTDLKIITIFRYVKRSAIFFSNTCGAIVKKKKKRKEKRLSIVRTKIDHERYRLLSAGHSGIGLFCISTFFLWLLRMVVSSHDKGIGNFNEQWAKTNHCFQTVRSRQLSRVVITRAYLATRKKYKKKTRKRREKKRKMNGVEINTRAYVATRLLLRWDYLYAVTLKTKVFGEYNHARLEVSWITSTRGLLLRGFTGRPPVKSKTF